MTDAGADMPLAGQRVLIVEDEYFIADDMAQSVKELGAEVVGPAPNCDMALTIIRTDQRIDFAVLDINLAGQPVFKVADLLAERGVPFVFATGYDESSIPTGYRLSPRWEKPFNPDDLARALPHLLQDGAV